MACGVRSSEKSGGGLSGTSFARAVQPSSLSDDWRSRATEHGSLNTVYFDESMLILQSSRTMRWLGTLLVVTTAAFGAWAQTNNAAPQARELSLQDCIQMALQHNLDLQIDRYNPQIAQLSLNAAYAGYDPSLSLSGQHDHNEAGTELLGGGFSIPGSIRDDDSFSGNLQGLLPWGTTYNIQANAVDITGKSFAVDTNLNVLGIPFANSSGSASINLSQPLLKNFWIDSTRLNIRVARNRLKYSEQTLRLQIMQTISTLEQAYFDLIYYRENVLVQQKAVELAERLVLENRKKLEVGALAPLDLQSAEAQAASTRAAVLAAQSQLGTQERVLKLLITDQYRDWAKIVPVPSGKLSASPPVVSLQDSWARGLSQRPELMQAKLDIERQGIVLKYDKNQLFPELDVFGTYGYNGSGNVFADTFYDIQEMNRPYYTYGGRLSYPLSNVRAKNTYKADKATLQQLVLTYKRLEQGVMIALDNDIGTLRANFDQVEATKAAREYEESALEAEQKKLDNGKSTTYTVLQVQRDLTNARGSEIQALDAYNRSLSQLSLDEGGTLQRLGINLEVK